MKTLIHVAVLVSLVLAASFASHAGQILGF
jgi:hypothetical protein